MEISNNRRFSSMLRIPFHSLWYVFVGNIIIDSSTLQVESCLKF